MTDNPARGIGLAVLLGGVFYALAYVIARRLLG